MTKRFLVLIALLLSAHVAMAQGTFVLGVTGPPENGLIARYEIPSTDSAAALTDSSGLGNNGTGTVGTAPAIGANGGVVCNGVGAVMLPASLNSAQTIAIYATIGNQGFANSDFWPVGGSVIAHSVAITVDSFGGIVGAGADSTAFNLNIVGSKGNGGTTGSRSNSGMLGTGSIILSMGATNDHVYINGSEISYYSNSIGPTSAGNQTSGNFQICGSAASGYMPNATIWKVFIYNRPLSSSEAAQLNTWLATQATNSAVNPPSNVNPSVANSSILFVQGDSIESGRNGTFIPPAPVAVLNGNPSPQYTVIERGIGGAEANWLTQSPATITGNYYNPIAQDNLMVLDLCTNDVGGGGRTTAQCMQSLSQIAKTWTNLGGRYLLTSLRSYTGHDSNAQSLNTAQLQNWRAMGAIGYVDYMSDANLGATNAYQNTLYFFDGTHPSQHGFYNDLTPIFQRAVNRANGHLDWGSATTYTTGAPAATAITAASETGNTMTFTSTLNPPVGACVIVTGVTPAGYNSPTTGGCWYVITTSSTNFTVWNGTTGLGAGTVFGSASVPLQKDLDVYFILGGNAAAPNFSLESCEGYSGQSLFAMVTNTNASPWTITPFKSSETINGGTTFTAPVASAANHPVVELKSIPNATGTGGCTWHASLE